MSTSSADTTTTSPGTTDASTDGTTVDPTGDTTGSSSGEMGCGEVDLLFVIDNSGSMAEEQDRLLAAFPQFLSTLRTQLRASDLHVMVTDVDGWPFELCTGMGSPCDPACLTPEGTCDSTNPMCFLPCALEPVCADSGIPCEGVPHDPCDEVLGAGVVQTWGMQSSQQDCAFASGARYIDQSEPDLEAAFSCAAQVGTGSLASTERPMEAIVQALSEGTEAFACNAGFLREAAQLVVVFITDESDDAMMDSAGNAPDWHAAVLAAKASNPTGISVLGLFGDGDLPMPVCTTADPAAGGAEPSPRLRAFLDLWGDQGVFGSVCAGSYEPAFTELLGVIEASCAGR